MGLKASAVLLRIEQAVDMVEPKAFDLAVGDPAEDEPVHGVEDLGKLDPDAGQVVDVEKPQIVDFTGCDAPEGDAIGLRLEPSVQGARIRLSALPVSSTRPP